MKYFAILFVMFFTLLVISAEDEVGPIQLTHNNIGDIVNVDLTANAVLSSNIEQNILGVILGLLNQQAAVVGSTDALQDPAQESADAVQDPAQEN